jgi:FkbM family methyltransferase
MLDVLLIHLRTIGFAPTLVFDIGAYEGTFLDLSRRIFPAATYWAFEPNLGKSGVLSGKADRVFTEVLNEKPGEVTFWESELSEQSGNSLLREQTNIPFRATQRRAIDIDGLVGDVVPDLVKLDTQGSEIAILKGGSRSICRAEAVIVEAHVRRYNVGAPLFPELFAFMHVQGYEMIDFVDAVRVQGLLIQSNVLFLKRSSPRFSVDARIEYAF